MAKVAVSASGLLSNSPLTWQGQGDYHKQMDSTTSLSSEAHIVRSFSLCPPGTLANFWSPNMPRNRDLRKPCVRHDGKITLHEQLIRGLVDSDPRMCRNGFSRSVKALFDRIGVYPDNVPLGEFVPDAYLLDEEAQHILIFEVEVTNALSDDKIASLGMFWFYMDCEASEWMPRLFVVDRYGVTTELDMLKCYGRVLMHHAPNRVPMVSLALA